MSDAQERIEAPSDASSRISELESENTSLRARVEALTACRQLTARAEAAEAELAEWRSKAAVYIDEAMAANGARQAAEAQLAGAQAENVDERAEWEEWRRSAGTSERAVDPVAALRKESCSDSCSFTMGGYCYTHGTYRAARDGSTTQNEKSDIRHEASEGPAARSSLRSESEK